MAPNFPETLPRPRPRRILFIPDKEWKRSRRESTGSSPVRIVERERERKRVRGEEGNRSGEELGAGFFSLLILRNEGN